MSRSGSTFAAPTAVGLGGALGGLTRHTLLDVWPYERGTFPWPVLTINVVGCVLIGVLMVVVEERLARHPLLRPFVGVGLIGGFTTFSTYALDTADVWRADEPYLTIGYLGGTLIAALAAVTLGMAATTGLLTLRRRRR